MEYLEKLSLLQVRRLIRNRRPLSFFLHHAVYVATRILGDYLVLKERRSYLVGRIVEVESYLGREDDASHSFGGKVTERNRIMYEEGGVIYTYLIYGMYWCFNIVVSKKDDPQAVFIRALEPVYGTRRMQRRRKAKRLVDLTNGPCRWTESFGVDGRLRGMSIVSDRIFVSRGLNKKIQVVRAKRVGIDYAQESKDLLLRFYIKGSPFVSRR